MTTLWHIHDPMRAQCWAFRPTLAALIKQLPPSIQLPITRSLSVAGFLSLVLQTVDDNLYDITIDYRAVNSMLKQIGVAL